MTTEPLMPFTLRTMSARRLPMDITSVTSTSPVGVSQCVISVKVFFTYRRVAVTP